MTSPVATPSAAEITKHHVYDPAGIDRIARRRPRTIEIVEPDPSWPAAYAEVEARIRAALGADGLVSVSHVGSTSVAGLPAKPVIDVDLVVPDPTREDAYVPQLEAAGFLFILREPNWHQHRFFGLETPYANLHVFGPGCAETVRHRIFRDWIASHEDDRAKYVAMKRAAAAAAREAGETTQGYNVRKEPVVREILERAFRAQGLLPPE
ncbi:hypothetical protein UCRPA7_7388 [Phaeoacremonium minimum UCRPA7]|uniref:GrpB domain protein n=1 Tax=Phaeoacremonium minimum (strain UCR-PA7) TaxID=1286976 RepID=R8BCT1_PHAM7|nr:hypothetical protein UCRPA7_7388 [Phaeoacremonium minimum UCRPA7]EON97100.1 hypothetical protein UCRPA7_7388 [Phaeoacremonium minimum UCRPA7]